MEMEAIRATSRPSKSLRRQNARERTPVDELVKRFELGLDLWTGEPLTGNNADDWLHVACGETEPGCVLSHDEERSLFELFTKLAWMNCL